MLSEKSIADYGGKAAILNYIKEKLPEVPIPNYVVKQQNDSGLQQILTNFNSMQKPVIVRSSSPFEYGDFEGIFDSIKGIHNKDDLAMAIGNVQKSALSKRALLYAKQNGFNLEEKMHTIIQDQIQSELVGTMMRHPNNPNRIMMNLTTNSGRRYTDSHCFYNFDEEKNVIDRHDEVVGIKENEIKQVIETYKKIEELKEISEDHNLFMEFGFRPFGVYQIRPFKKFETTDFELPNFENLERGKDYVHTENCMGITPKEGIVLPVLKSVGSNEAQMIYQGAFEFFKQDSIDFGLPFELGNVVQMQAMGVLGMEEYFKNLGMVLNNWHDLVGSNIKDPYCFVTTSIKDDAYDVDLSLPKMEAAIIGHAKNFLTHNPIRIFKKANVSMMMKQSFVVNEFYKEIASVEDKLRIISNGKEAVAIRE